MSIWDAERLRYVPHVSPLNDPAANFAKLRWKWTAPTPKRLPRLQLPSPEALALLKAPPPAEQFVMPVKPEKISWEWLAKQAGVSTTHAHNIVAGRCRSPAAGNVLAMVKAFGRPPVRKRGSKPAAGLCCRVGCGQPLRTARLCAFHAKEASKRALELYHRRSATGWRQPKKPRIITVRRGNHQPHPKTGKLVSRQRVWQVKQELRRCAA